MLKCTISVARQRSADDGLSREPPTDRSGNASLEAVREHLVDDAVLLRFLSTGAARALFAGPCGVSSSRTVTPDTATVEPFAALTKVPAKR